MSSLDILGTTSTGSSSRSSSSSISSSSFDDEDGGNIDSSERTQTHNTGGGGGSGTGAGDDALTLGTGHRAIHSYGLFRESEVEDLNLLVNNYTAPALARALRERETTLQVAAAMADQGNYTDLAPLLFPFLKSSVEKRRQKRHNMNLSSGFSRKELVVLQRYLHRMPRQVFHAAERRASVVIPLCNVDGVASVLFERRSDKVRTHKQQVCFPGGMVDEGVDATIIQTSLREMEEELGIPPEKVEVLGILRCNWNEVASMTGIAVTPVVGFIGDLKDIVLTPNPDEVEQLFSVPLKALLDESNWTIRDYSTPVFNGGPFVIWGLTAYLLDRFLKVRLLYMPCSIPMYVHVFVCTHRFTLSLTQSHTHTHAGRCREVPN